MAETVRGVPETGGKPASARPWIIIVVVILVLCCMLVVCGGGLWWLWENGDELLEDFLVLYPNFLLI